MESCKLNGIDPQDYLKHLFECILHGKNHFDFLQKEYICSVI
nr:transposase domain-containing protein [Bacteroides caecimuris]